MKTKQDVLQACKIEGNIIKLPNIQLDRKLYQDVAKSIELIGGKWKGGKVMGFVFTLDPTELLEQISGGENRNIKKEHQFFATPAHLADELVKLADLQEKDTVLEPSAGQGAIIDAVLKTQHKGEIFICENMPTNCIILNKKYGDTQNVYFLRPLNGDFLKLGATSPFTKIIANPPFSKNQDIEHITKMYSDLASGGRIVAMASKHWQNSSNQKESNFRLWLQNVNARIIEVDAGEFKDSGTNIATVIIIIEKP